MTRPLVMTAALPRQELSLRGRLIWIFLSDLQLFFGISVCPLQLHARGFDSLLPEADYCTKLMGPYQGEKYGPP